MPDWSTDELDDLADAGQVELSTVRPDGTLRAFVPVWIVRVDDAVYVRSYRGEGGSWYRHTRRGDDGHIRSSRIDRDVTFTDAAPGRDVVDAAYRQKYGAGSSYVDTMVRDDVAATTLRVMPK